MIKTKDNKGITLVSLIITIVLMIIISSTAIYVSFDRFQINKFNKMINDLELLYDKVSNYYLKYDSLPIVRNENNQGIEYTYTSLDFEEEGKFYILDLEAMEGLSLNYGKEGFENLNSSDDVYIINEQSLKIYYVRGMELEGVVYYTISNDALTNDNIPPSKPQINILSGTTDDDGTYITEIEVEIIPGKDSWAGVNKTTYSINNIAEADIETLTNNILKIIDDGTYEIKARSYDENDNISDYTTKTVVIQKADIVLDKTELSLELEEGKTVAGTLSATLENVSKDFKWTASEDSGLIISGEGNTKTITATKGVENATITITYGDVSATCNVTVTEKQVEENEISNTI